MRETLEALALAPSVTPSGFWRGRQSLYVQRVRLPHSTLALSILGPLEIPRNGDLLPLPTAERALLALLCSIGTIVSPRR